MTDTPPTDESQEPIDNIEPIEIQSEMEDSFLEYAMSVIVSRALPDARDGLKPVHRRILWSMFDAGHRPDRSHVKCATVVGDVIGRFHPHGDSAIYDALVRMGQTFSLRHTLIDPHGNFGSPDDPPAAYRYTECRLTPLAMRLLADIDEDTVDFRENFDGKHEEPTVLPARFPNLLVNGSQGIAVGMATNIPPHNLRETIDATIHLIDNPEATPDDLMEFIKGPDFPTRAQILGRVGIRDAYRTGRGSIRLRAVAEIVEGRTNDQIVVTEVPYQTSVDQIARKTAELVERGDITGLREIRNESAKGKTRLVFELKRDATALVILNNLYKYTPMQTTFSVNMVALVDGAQVPRTLNLRDALVVYVEHQREVVRRRTEDRLRRAKARAHILEGLLRALDIIDEIITAIRASEDRAEARDRLMSDTFGFSEIQSNFILDMTLSRLTRLARSEIEKELEQKRVEIAELEAILADDNKLRDVIKTEMLEIREEFGTDRFTALVPDPGELDIEDLIDDEDLVVTLSSSGYIKSISAEEFRTQGRGGRGVTGAKLKDDDDDLISHLLHTTAHAYLLFFSNRGRVYRIKAHEIPVSSRTSRGMALVNLLQLQPDEQIQTIVDTRDYETNRFLFFATRQGRVKKTLFTAYDSSLRSGLIAINLNDGDELVAVVPTNGEDEIFMASRQGQALRFSEDDVRPMGRTAAGVVGMKFRQGDELVSCAVTTGEDEFLVVTSEGFGKRVSPDLFTRKKRSGLGVRCVTVNEKKGKVVGAMFVAPEDEVMLISSGGVIIRTAVSAISQQGRDATGVRVMNLDSSDQVSAVARMFPNGDEDDFEGDADLDGVSRGELGVGGGIGEPEGSSTNGSGPVDNGDEAPS
ncbi:MAG: DNA gyrase subunit A [Actinomycetia bacterium]|nr:DNA gyrase subunit A [Actinomycetes bacterium]